MNHIKIMPQIKNNDSAIVLESSILPRPEKAKSNLYDYIPKLPTGQQTGKPKVEVKSVEPLLNFFG